MSCHFHNLTFRSILTNSPSVVLMYNPGIIWWIFICNIGSPISMFYVVVRLLIMSSSKEKEFFQLLLYILFFYIFIYTFNLHFLSVILQYSQNKFFKMTTMSYWRLKLGHIVMDDYEYIIIQFLKTQRITMLNNTTVKVLLKQVNRHFSLRSSGINCWHCWDFSIIVPVTVTSCFMKLLSSLISRCFCQIKYELRISKYDYNT